MMTVSERDFNYFQNVMGTECNINMSAHPDFSSQCYILSNNPISAFEMVMERPLSPQCVGREFVRQYYTLLNEAPAHLHRFYNNNSLFIHCGIDTPNSPVVGQKQIHQQIQQLNFQDCRTKIKRVDSQATLANGVVVQVFGKLSNAGQRMRKFTQTFVLAAQSPKKYYVHNDIFRYQDDDSEEELSRSEVEDHDDEVSTQNDIRQNDQGAYYGSINPVVNGTSDPKIIEEPPMVVPQVVPQPIEPHQPPPMNMNSMDMTQQSSPSVMQPQEITQAPPTAQPQASFVEEVPVVKSESQDAPYMNQNQQPPPQQHIIEPNNEPKTYAGLVKSGTPASGTYYSNTVMNHQGPPKVTSPPPMKNDYINKNSYSRSSLSQNDSKPQRMQEQSSRSSYSSGPRPSINNDDNGNYGGPDGSRRRTSYLSDSQQLFIGNVPLTATEQDLRKVFEKFGEIHDLRICSKGAKGGAGSARLPNYGFVVFEDKSSVANVLRNTPIMLPGENGSTPLNVEEKKRRTGGDSGGGGGGGSRGGPRGGMRGGMGGIPRGGRGGGSGAGGGMRFGNPNNNRR